ncbi:phosphotransferase [Yoonia sp. BS5-3]|uniref:Aminoglycoside phosphotransferase family protein n=1 Tax=Yoonia phaeophyticola TaxID=3137369 RepID=A0ABZ2V8K9_9RHOB
MSHSDREAVIENFLAQSRWVGWARRPIVADASARSYTRLEKEGASVILMDAPPNQVDNTEQFIAVAKYLSECGLNPPRILAQELADGILVLSDLGQLDFAEWLRSKPDDAAELYKAAIDILIRLESCRPPTDLTRLTPELGADMIAVTGECYAQGPIRDLQNELLQALRQFAYDADTFALRDFHAENLIWRPDQTGTARVGLLDFQDAIVAPCGYDLVSLLRDARRDTDPDFVQDMLQYYFDKTGKDQGFRTQLACLGIQRNLRILGIFARLATVMNKPRYIDLIPRVWYNIQQDLDHAALANLRDAINDTLPFPDHDFLESLRQ